jgi:hypothetical protein
MDQRKVIMKSHSSMKNTKVKTTVLFEKSLLKEIDKFNPFQTRKAFFSEACKLYLNWLRHKTIDDQLAKACAEAQAEDRAVNEEWEPITLEEWQ